MNAVNLETVTSFIVPHFITELGEEGLTSQEIATTIGMRKDNLHNLIIKLQVDDMIEVLESSTSVNSNGCSIKEYLLNVDNAKFLVTQTATLAGRSYCKFLIQCEKKLRSSIPIVPPSPLQLARQVVELMEMQEHQVKALSTSQQNNSILTKKIKKLEMNLAGKNEEMSLSQYLSAINLHSNKGISTLVGKLKKIEGAPFTMKIVGADGYPTTYFKSIWLDSQINTISEYFGK